MCRWTSGEARGGRVIVGGAREQPAGAGRGAAHARARAH